MDILNASDRHEWRKWLEENFDKKHEIGLVFPKKASGEKSISYNDAVEEALCFGWIDSKVNTLDINHRVQRFSPRKKGSTYSRPNIERLKWLDENGMLHPSVKDAVKQLIDEPYIFPQDIIAAIKDNKKAWENYSGFAESYKRIRIAYIDEVRDRPDEFKKRLQNFIKKTENNKIIGYGGIEKYYK
ncbi:MAG: YdeI/OmpD-associated family protein [Saccharofermentanales bacterium]